MQRTLAWVVVALGAAGLAPFGAIAQTQPNPMQPAHGQRADIWFLIDLAQEDVMELAKALPAEKYTFRPTPDVRTAGEVYMHIAEGNFTITELWGRQPPPGFDPQAFVKDGANKPKVLATLKASYDYLRDEIKALSEDDMNRMITVYDHPGTIREALMFVNNHNQAHLGQSIAYARMAGIVPPWTAATLAQQEKEKKEKGEKEKPKG